MSALDLLFVIVLWLQLQLGNSVEFTNRYHKDNKLNHNSYNNYNNHNNHNHNNHNNAIGKKNHYNSHLISTLVFNNSVTTEQIDYSQRNAYDYEIILQTAHPSIDRQHAVSKKYKIWDHPANVFAGSNVYLLTTNTNSNTDSNTAIDSPTVTEVAEYIHNGGGNTMILPEVPPASSQIHFVIMFLLLPPTISGSIPADVQLTDELLHQLLTKMKFPIHLRIRTVIVYKDRIVYPLGVKFTLPTLREAFVEIVRRSAALKFVKTEVAIDTILNGHVNINDYCYFFGGYSRDDNEVLKTISVYSLVDKEPKLLRTIPFVQDLPLATSAITTDGVRYIYLAAGVSGPKLSGGSKWVYRFDIFTESFKELPPLPENRQSGTLTLFRNKLHYIGGSVDREMTVGMVTHYTMDLSDYNNLKWEVATPLPFSRVSHHTVVLKNENNEESLYVVGGNFEDARTLSSGVITPEFDMYSTIKLSADQSQWQEAPAFPVGISHMESIVLGDKKAVLFFGGQSSYLTYRDNLSAPQYVHAAIPHLYMYYPSKQLVKLQGFLDAGLGAAKYVSPMYTTHDEEYRLWLQGGEKERDNVLSPPYVDSVYRVEGTINYKDTLLHRFSSMDTTLTARRPIVDSLGKNEAKMLLIPIIDGGLTNLKMNIIGAAEIAYKNSMVLVLPELILDWTVARRKELAANVTILSINRCGTNVKCGSFEDFFDTDTFINTCKKLGIDVIRNELPREVLDLPSKLIETKDRAAMDASGSFFYFPYLELCSDGCQAFIYGDEHYYPDLHNAYEQKKKYTFIGVSPYWFINSFTATDIARRNILINEAFLPSKKLGDLVSSVRQRLPEKYHCLHLRIEQDLRIHCTMADYKDDLDCYLSAEVIYERLKEHYKPGDTVYVATGKTLDSDAALAMFANTYKIIRKEEVIPNIAESLEDSRELLGMIDHEICLYSDVFVGSKTSSFSFWVGAWRNMRRMKWAYYNPLFKNNKDPLTGRITNYTHNTEFTKFKIEDSFIGG